MSDKEFTVQTDMWLSNARSIAVSVPSLDFLGWHGEHFVVVRSTGVAGAQQAGLRELEQKVVEVKDLPSRRRLDCGNGVDLGGEDAAWLERKDVPMDYEVPALM